MGIVEDHEPSLKHVKLSSGESTTFLDQSFVSAQAQTVVHSLGDKMACPSTSQGEEETVGVKGVIKRSEFVKVITSALYSLGYNNTGAFLQQESGIPLHSSEVNLFIEHVRDGTWDQSLEMLNAISILDETTVKSASFLILEQKFFQLLRRCDTVAALHTLRKEIVPLQVDLKRVRDLAACLISPPGSSPVSEDSTGDNKDAKSGFTVLENLQKLLPPAVFIPDKKLEHLVEKALDVQRDACLFHNTSGRSMSLYCDHLCGRDQIPSQTVQILQEHNDEVWFLQFSHNGKYLASSSKDQSAIIWEVKGDGHISMKHRLTGHQKSVLIVSWSRDDNQLLTCGQEETIRRWDIDSGECIHVYEKPGVSFVSCGWFPDNKGIFAGMSNKNMCLWDLDGKELECWKGQRTLQISDVAVTDDGKKIISICRENAILLFDRELKFDRLIEEEEVVTSFSLSNDNKFLLVNLMNEEIHLWTIEGYPKIVTKYRGHTCNRFVIRSCFGGFNQAFIASGSEDSQVYIWHKGSGELLSSLPGHSGAVNCVSWNTANHQMLASASDDRTIRIWGLKNFNQ